MRLLASRIAAFDPERPLVHRSMPRTNTNASNKSGYHPVAAAENVNPVWLQDASRDVLFRELRAGSQDALPVTNTDETTWEKSCSA